MGDRLSNQIEDINVNNIEDDDDDDDDEEEKKIGEVKKY
jgi:hypothetical protein